MSINTQINPLTGASFDMAAEQRAKLKSLFPAAFTETRTGKGEFIESVDFEKLKAELGSFTDFFESRHERYGMDWPGKKDALKLIQTLTYATLKPDREESVNFDATENLFIEGDNLEVLKLLQKSYYGKIKTMFIDPPYNTGKDFIYPDNYSESLDTYLLYAGLLDQEGRRIESKANTIDDGRFHTKWLNMIFPRLYLARNLLADDGLIFICIDDKEVDNLRKVCDEVFGSQSFVATFIWEKRTNRENRKEVSARHDYVLCYCKRRIAGVKALKQQPMTAKALANYKNPDKDVNGSWKSDPATAQAGHGTKDQFYVLTAPNGKKHKLESGRCWLYTEKVMKEEIAANHIWFGKDGNGVPRVKTYLEEKARGLTPETIWFAEEVGTNEIAKNKLKELFDGYSVFDTPKPVDLVSLALQISPPGPVVDFFAGSCATAEAVLTLNQESKLKRNFIVVQLPEPCEEGSEALKMGLKTIAEVGKERIRRAAAKLNEADGNAKKQDRGFRVFKLDKSNFRAWQKLDATTKPEALAEQLELHIEHIDSTATPEDLLFELLIKSGFTPSEKVTVQKLAGIDVYSVAEGDLMICLAEKITRDLIDAVAQAEPSQFVCLDSAFAGNDQLKANAVQTFTARNQGRDKASQIVFRTV